MERCRSGWIEARCRDLGFRYPLICLGFLPESGSMISNRARAPAWESGVYPLIGIPSRSVLYCSPTPSPGGILARAVIVRALRWLYPWDKVGDRRYPGYTRGCQSVFARHYSPQAIQHWQRGYRCPEPSVMGEIVAAIRSRCASGLALADELEAIQRAEEARPRRRTGYRTKGDVG